MELIFTAESFSKKQCHICGKNYQVKDEEIHFNSHSQTLYEIELSESAHKGRLKTYSLYNIAIKDPDSFFQIISTPVINLIEPLITNVRPVKTSLSIHCIFAKASNRDTESASVEHKFAFHTSYAILTISTDLKKYYNECVES